jgi:DNA-binding MarR family transcriptional regulator
MATKPSTNKPPEAHDPWVCLLRGHAVVRRTVATQLQASHGLTVNEYEALLLLSRADGKCMRRVDLAEALQLSASGVTRLLEGLEQQGMVGKAVCPTDGRVTYAVLTQAGSRTLAKASGAHIAALRTVFEERYTRTELATLAELLARLSGPAGAPQNGPIRLAAEAGGPRSLAR